MKYQDERTVILDAGIALKVSEVAAKLDITESAAVRRLNNNPWLTKKSYIVDTHRVNYYFVRGENTGEPTPSINSRKKAYDPLLISNLLPGQRSGRPRVEKKVKIKKPNVYPRPRRNSDCIKITTKKINTIKRKIEVEFSEADIIKALRKWKVVFKGTKDIVHYQGEPCFYRTKGLAKKYLQDLNNVYIGLEFDILKSEPKDL